MASSKRIKRRDVEKKFYELKSKLKESLKLIDKLEKGLEEQKRVKAEYEGAITILHEILTGQKSELRAE